MNIKQPNRIEVSETKEAKQKTETKKGKKQLVYISLILIVALCVAAVLLYVFVVKPANKNDADTTEQIKVVGSSEISEEIERAKTGEEKAQLYLQLATAKQREGSTEEALVAVLNSIELKKTHEAYAMAGAFYDELGDTEKAIAMYEKAIELTEKVDDPEEVSYYNDYHMEIKRLRG